MKIEDCPVRTTLQVVGGKWKPVILLYLTEGTQRFGQLRRLMPDATQKMLTQQLRELEASGIITRKVHAVVPPKVEYSLTAYGRTLRPLMKAMCQWGMAHREKTRSARSPVASRS